ncbi:uncharacterized protein [Drosophila pseudoobscura]|uniref:Uncharacterized protein isoform X2 n=1 Tax=Drosophila pseudoobscura pseudoobscura TaxID=46245 RepID=A0A6I8VAP3_DROPS|nr:uncharacterized protein LOC4801499 isoform X2 [Drosophila pseudoobscura]
MKTGTIISCCLLIFNNVCCQSGSEQKLIDPHDGWSNFVMDFDQTLGESCPQCECPEMPQRSPAAIEDALSLVYFKKFVNLLFQRKSLQKLEVDAMLDVINSHQEPLSYDEMSWMQRLRNFVVRPSAEAEQRERLRKSSKLNRTYCLPDHVFIMYINDLFLKQLELLLEKVSQTMTKLTSGLSFPYNLIAPIFLVALVGYIIKLTFKYVISPRAWGTLLHTRPGHTDTPTMLQSQASIAGRETVGDCISGENLKMLLNVIGDTQKSVKQQLPAVSGVQELMGPLEAPSAEDKKPKLDVSNNSSSSSDSKSHSRSQTEEDGFTVVDDHEEDAIHNI